MKDQFVGIDLAKRTMEVRVVSEEDPIGRHGLKTDKEGWRRLCRLLKGTDTAVFEICAYVTMLAWLLIREAGCKVHLLNEEPLQVIRETS
jgi:hypothetical protein